MEEPTPQAWIRSRSPKTQRFVKSGLIGFLAAILITAVQYFIWLAMGWGSANFLPTWVLVVIYVIAAYFGVAVFYYVLGFTAAVQRKFTWLWSACVGMIAMFWVAGALAHSIPQLSTLVASSPVEREILIHSGRNNVSGGRSMRRYPCRTSIRFGPFLQFRGGWCGIYMGPNEVWRFSGQGNAIALRIHDWHR